MIRRGEIDRPELPLENKVTSTHDPQAPPPTAGSQRWHQSNDVPLYDEILGEENIGTTVPAFLAGTVVLGYLLFGAVLLRRAVSSANTR